MTRWNKLIIPSDNRSTARCLLIIVILAAGLRILVTNFIGDSRVQWNYEYEEIAQNLLTRGEYAYSFYNLAPSLPTSFIPPIYPFFLAFARSLTTAGDSILKVLQIVVSCMTLISFYALGTELGASNRQILLATFLFAIYPPFAAYTANISTVTLETFFVITAIYLVLRTVKKESILSAIGAGFMIALASLTRSNWLMLLPLAVLWMIWYLRKAFATHLELVIAMLLATIVAITPWIIYNRATHHAWVFTSTNGGLNFWIGNNALASGEYIFPTEINRETVLAAAKLPEVDRDHYFYSLGFAFIREAPTDFLSLFGRKFIYYLFFRPNIGSTYQGANLEIGLARYVFIISWISLLPFAFIGLFNLRERHREHTWLIITFISQAIISSLYFVGTRFRTPIDGIVIIWASIGLFALANRLIGTNLPTRGT
jgi:4-amino-4-deoxy-L-arabinose transferase-like glycosyltransferase